MIHGAATASAAPTSHAPRLAESSPITRDSGYLEDMPVPEETRPRAPTACGSPVSADSLRVGVRLVDFMAMADLGRFVRALFNSVPVVSLGIAAMFLAGASQGEA